MYYTEEYFGVLVYAIGLAQALQALVQMYLFINILKCTFQTRFKIIPVTFIRAFDSQETY